MLNSLAQRFQTSARCRHGLFLTASFFSIAFVGYHFGTFDQAIHIPFLKKYVDASLFPGDKFFDLRLQHYSYFWLFFQPFYRLGILEPVMFATHMLATYLTFWALWVLSEALFQSPLASLLSLAAFMLPHVGFAGFPFFEFSLLNRTFVLPFLLWALILFLRRRYLPAFALLGVMYNLHVISVNFVLGLILFDSLIEFRQVGWRNLLLGMIVFVACALPVLIWKATTSHVDFTPRPEWFSIIARGTLYNLFFLLAPYVPILLASLSGVSTLALFVIAHRNAPACRHDHTIVIFMWGVLAILTVQVVTAEWLPITIIIQSQIMRAGIFALMFGYLYFAHYLARLYSCSATRRADFAVLAGALIVSPLPVAPVIIWGLQRLMASVRWRPVATAAALAAMFAGSVAVVLQYHLWYPGIYVFAHQTPWYQAQIWARDHTPKGAVFITPPHIWSFYDSEWRVFSERSTVVTHSELLEAAFAPEYMDYWRPRFEALAPGALERFQGNFFANQEITAQAFYRLSSDDLRRVARRYGASYLVVEKPHLRDFPVAYENDQFVVYDLRTRIGSGP